MLHHVNRSRAAMATSRRAHRMYNHLYAVPEHSSTPPSPTNNVLLEATVQPRTATVYRKAVLAFTQWANDHHETAYDEQQMDHLLVDYFHEQFQRGKGKSLASNTLNGLVWLHPELKFQLPRSSQAVKGWNKLTPGHSYPPLTWELAVIIAVQFTRAGCYDQGIGVLLAFDCLLRVSELVSLRREDVIDDADHRMGFEHKGMMIILRRTKTGMNKSVKIEEPSVIELVRSLVHRTPPGHRLFNCSANAFRSNFHRVCSSLGLSLRYVPHSLRHGGATRYYHVKRWPIEDVMQRGRWASTKSTRIYIQSGAALLALMSIPSAIAKLSVLMAHSVLIYMTTAHELYIVQR